MWSTLSILRGCSAEAFARLGKRCRGSMQDFLANWAVYVKIEWNNRRKLILTVYYSPSRDFCNVCLYSIQTYTYSVLVLTVEYLELYRV